MFLGEKMNCFIIAIPHNTRDVFERSDNISKHTIKYIIVGKEIGTSLYIFDNENFKKDHKRPYIRFLNKDYKNWIYDEKDIILNNEPNLFFEYFSIKENELNDFDFEFHVNNFNLLMDII
jgi:hypothetical protein